MRRKTRYLSLTAAGVAALALTTGHERGAHAALPCPVLAGLHREMRDEVGEHRDRSEVGDAAEVADVHGLGSPLAFRIHFLDVAESDDGLMGLR